MPHDGPLRLNLKPLVRESVELALCGRVSSAVEAAGTRDDQLQTWRDQLEGLGQTAQNTRWKGACDLTDPISFEAFLTILSQITQALHRDPKVAVEAFQPEDDENAQVLEQWLSVEGNRIDIERHIYDAAHNACRDTAAVLYCGWNQKTRISRETGYQKPGEARVYTEEEREDEEQYEEVPLSEEVVEEGYDVRVVDLADFYLYPPDAPSVMEATACAERMYCTADDLLDGIEDFGYDAEAVHKLIAQMPSQVSEYREVQNDQDGIDDADGRDGYYEVFVCYTRLPYLTDADKQVPRYLRQDDFICVCCPASNIVLKLDFSPFKERPYFGGGILPKAGRFQGYSLMGMLEGLQGESNSNVQFTVDSYNITMSPALKVKKSAATDLNKYNVFPGAQIPVDDMTDIEPLEWDRAPLRDGLAYQTYLQNRAKGLVTAEGQGQLTAKVRKQGEIENVQAQTSAKFGLYLWNFQRTIVAELYRRMISLKLEFGDMDDDGEDFSYEGKPHKITSRALRGKYRIVPTSTSLTHSPEARIEVGKQKMAIQEQYLGAKAKLPPDVLPLIWHSSRELLLDLGERNAEAWIGEEPKKPAPAAEAPQNGAGGQQQGNPAPGQSNNNVPYFNGVSNGTGVNN